MKHLLSLFFLLSISATLPAQDAATNALLIEQRDQLVATHTTALAAAAADFKQQLATITADRDAKAAELTELKTRINSVLNGLLMEELKTGDGPRAELLRKLIAEAGKSDVQLKLEAAQKAAADAATALAAAKAAAGQ